MRREAFSYSHLPSSSSRGVSSSHPVSVLVDRRADTLDTTTVGSGLSSARRRFGAVAQSAGASPRAHASTSVASSASRSASEADVPPRAFASSRAAPRGESFGRVRVTRGGEHVQRVVARHGDGAAHGANARNVSVRRSRFEPSAAGYDSALRAQSSRAIQKRAVRLERRGSRRGIGGVESRRVERWTAAIPDPYPSTGSWR